MYLAVYIIIYADLYSKCTPRSLHLALYSRHIHVKLLTTSTEPPFPYSPASHLAIN